MRRWLWCGLAIASAVAGAQMPVRVGPAPVKVGTLPGSAIPAETAAALTGLAARAPVIFVGRVTEVERHDDAGFVDVVFSIETAVRGCSAGAKYTLREWSGLWAGWPGRYGVGQKRLMLLAARGPSGMSAPVGGMAGMIPVVGSRQPPLVHGASAPPAESAAELTEESVDLRWVQAAAQRTVDSAAARTVQVGAPGVWRGPVKRMPVADPGVSPGTGLSAVLTLLGAGGLRAH